MLVVKFGGTSVGTKEALSLLVSILKDSEHSGRVALVVVSALSGITDSLIAAARRMPGNAKNCSPEGGPGSGGDPVSGILRRHLDISAAFLSGDEKKAVDRIITETCGELERMLDGVGILGELSERSLDGIMSFGERLSAPLVAAALRAEGIAAEYLDSRETIVTDDNYGAARVIQDETFRRIRERAGKAKAGTVFVASGFVGAAKDRSTTTLGRGGSDLSAALYGAALDAEKLEIWTDVDGIMTADPKLVKNAFRIDSISYEEAMELSHFGAKVLHPPTVKPALEKNIPIVIRNTFNPACPGTAIVRAA
ncbi:MAG: aspartate kinase, partial [Treponema sp.]|nr:aspartate kinase [Treponema sp.]